MNDQQADDREEALTVADIVKRYKIGRTRACAEIKSGRLKSYQVGRSRRITPKAARQWQQTYIAATEATGEAE